MLVVIWCGHQVPGSIVDDPNAREIFPSPRRDQLVPSSQECGDRGRQRGLGVGRARARQGDQLCADQWM